jgi:ribosomal protein L7/L12
LWVDAQTIALKASTLTAAGHATPIETIKAIALAQGLGLGEAKQVFSRSPAWSKEAATGDAIHSKIIALLEKERRS